MINVPKYFLTLVFVSALGAQPPGNTPVSNAELIKRFFVEEPLRQLEKVYDDSAEVILTVSPKNSLAKWIWGQFVDAAVSAKIRMVRDEKLKRFKVEIDSPAISISYAGAGHKMLILQDKYRRKFEGRFHLRITEPSGQIVVSQPFRTMFTDTLKSNELKAVENSRLAFTHGFKTPSKKVHSWLEPALLTASTLAVFVLFYSLRSGK